MDESDALADASVRGMLTHHRLRGRQVDVGSRAGERSPAQRRHDPARRAAPAPTTATRGAASCAGRAASSRAASGRAGDRANGGRISAAVDSPCTAWLCTTSGSKRASASRSRRVVAGRYMSAPWKAARFQRGCDAHESSRYGHGRTHATTSSPSTPKVRTPTSCPRTAQLGRRVAPRRARRRRAWPAATGSRS